MTTHLDVLMARFTERVPGVRHAIAVASDGLLAAASPQITRDIADSMAAITFGLVSLTAQSSQVINGGRVSLTMIEAHGGYLFLLPGNGGSALVAWAEPNCDVGQVGYELAVLAASIDAGRPPAAPTPPPGYGPAASGYAPPAQSPGYASPAPSYTPPAQGPGYGPPSQGPSYPPPGQGPGYPPPGHEPGYGAPTPGYPSPTPGYGY